MSGWPKSPVGLGDTVRYHDDERRVTAINRANQTVSLVTEAAFALQRYDGASHRVPWSDIELVRRYGE